MEVVYRKTDNYSRNLNDHFEDVNEYGLREGKDGSSGYMCDKKKIADFNKREKDFVNMIVMFRKLDRGF